MANIITFNVLQNTKQIPFTKVDSTSVLIIKKEIEELVSHPTHSIQLHYKGREVENTETLKDMGIANGERMMCVLRPYERTDAAMDAVKTIASTVNGLLKEAKQIQEDPSKATAQDINRVHELLTQQLLELDSVDTSRAQVKDVRKAEIQRIEKTCDALMKLHGNKEEEDSGPTGCKGVLFVTTNPGKMTEAKQVLESVGVSVLFPTDLGLEVIDVDETGSTLEENAALKANAYASVAKEYIVIGDDTGLEIDALGGEPGIKVRRWKGYPMEDEEIIQYALEKLDGVDPSWRGAQFRTVIAVKVPGNSEMKYFDGTLRGSIQEEPAELRVKGLPFESLFWVTEWDTLLGEAHQLSADDREAFGMVSHREKALRTFGEWAAECGLLGSDAV